MLYSWSSAAALAVFLLGITYRIINFFRITIGPAKSQYGLAGRIRGFLSGIAGCLISPVRIFKLIKTFFLDVVLQIPLMVRNPLKWFMHICIYWGVAGLFFFHALEGAVSERLFSDYQSTLNPFMILRNAGGLMVILGVALAIYHRKAHFRLKQISKRTDHIAVALLALIIISGFCLEASKIISAPVFDEMMAEWGDMIYEEDLPALKAFWQEEFNVRFTGQHIAVTPELLEQGELLNDDSCYGCHARPQWAFVSYPISIAMGPWAEIFNKYRMDRLLLKIHFLSCFFALAYLPFSKFLHVLTTPLSLLVRGAAGQHIQRSENRATRRALDLSACTRCGTCTLHCAVAPVYEIMGSRWLFPSERLARIQESALGKPMDQQDKEACSQGSFICTLCNKCSQICPAGLDLQDIWKETRKQLARESYPDPAARIQALQKKHRRDDSDDKNSLVIKSGENPAFETFRQSMQAASFSQCYTCLTCTSSCPVVRAGDGTGGFGSAPHQVIHALSIGQMDLIRDAFIVWNCLTCYRCQENCPQGVQITDIFYEIKNMAYRQEFGI